MKAVRTHRQQERGCRKAWTGTWLLAAAWAVVAALAGPVAAAATGSGLEVTGELITELAASGTGGTWDWAVREELRIGLRAAPDPGAGSSMSGELAFSSASQTGSPSSSGAPSMRVDRVAVQWNDGATRVTLGRQRIAWGVGYVFSPMDLFNPPNPLDPTGRRVGADALVVRRSTGPLSFWSLVAALPPPEGSGRPRVGAIYGEHVGETDLRAAYLSDGADGYHKIGAAARGDLGSAGWSLGWHGEILHERPWDSRVLAGAGANAATGGNRWQAVLGLERSLLDGRLFTLTEYRYVAGGSLPSPARYLAAHAAYSLDEFTSLDAGVVVDLDGRAAWVEPSLKVAVDDRLRVELGAGFPAGPKEKVLSSLTGWGLLPDAVGTFGGAVPDVVAIARARYTF